MRVIICWFNICYYDGSCGSLQKLLILDKWNFIQCSCCLKCLVKLGDVLENSQNVHVRSHLKGETPKLEEEEKKTGFVGVERWICPVEVATAFRSSIFQRSKRGKEERSDHRGGCTLKNKTTATMNYTLNSGSVFCHIRREIRVWIRAVFCGTQEKKRD